MKTKISSVILVLFLSLPDFLFSQVVVNDEYFYKQWYLSMPGTDATRADIRVLDAWIRTMGNANQKIADIEGDDSGLNGYPSTNHPDLICRIITQGQGFTGEHSTNVSGLLVANHNNIGIAGLNKYAQLRSYLFSSEDNQQWADKIRDARLDGNQIINISQGKYESMPSVAIRLMEAHNSNIVTVISAGNNNSSISNPGSFAGIITVGASTKDNTSATWSNFGSKLNFLAPGGSTLLDPTNDKNIYTTFSNGSYKYASGTSMAAPIVAGAASLLLAYKPDLTNEDVKNILRYSCDKLEEMGTNDFNTKCGYGRINLKKAMQLLEPPNTLTHGNATFIKLGDNVAQIFINNPVLATGTYNVDYYKLSIDLDNLYYLEPPKAWLPTGFSGANPNNCQEFLSVSTTSNSVHAYTYFYYVRTNFAGDPINMWFPYNPSAYYTILGKPNLFSVTISGPSIAPCTTGTWSANVSGGYPPYTYQWYHMYTSSGGLESSLQKENGIIQPDRLIDTWYPVGNNTSTLNYYLCGGNSYLRVDVKDSHNTLKTVQYYVAGSNGGGGGLEKESAENSSNDYKSDSESETPKEYSLKQNYPNPFNPSTIISYRIKTEGRVSIKIYDTLGKEVATLVDKIKPAGSYEAEFNGKELPSGMYIYKMQSAEYLSTNKMLLIK